MTRSNFQCILGIAVRFHHCHPLEGSNMYPACGLLLEVQGEDKPL